MSFSWPELNFSNTHTGLFEDDTLSTGVTSALLAGSAVVAGFVVGKLVKDHWFNGADQDYFGTNGTAQTPKKALASKPSHKTTLDYAEMTRDELYEQARKRDISGRSQMNKAELLSALSASPTAR